MDPPRGSAAAVRLYSSCNSLIDFVEENPKMDFIVLSTQFNTFSSSVFTWSWYTVGLVRIQTKSTTPSRWAALTHLVNLAVFADDSDDSIIYSSSVFISLTIQLQRGWLGLQPRLFVYKGWQVPFPFVQWPGECAGDGYFQCY